jgi:hypothetical protein
MRAQRLSPAVLARRRRCPQGRRDGRRRPPRWGRRRHSSGWCRRTKGPCRPAKHVPVCPEMGVVLPRRATPAATTFSNGTKNINTAANTAANTAVTLSKHPGAAGWTPGARRSQPRHGDAHAAGIAAGHRVQGRHASRWRPATQRHRACPNRRRGDNQDGRPTAACRGSMSRCRRRTATPLAPSLPMNRPTRKVPGRGTTCWLTTNPQPEVASAPPPSAPPTRKPTPQPRLVADYPNDHYVEGG